MPRHLLFTGRPLLQRRMHQHSLRPKQLRRLWQRMRGGRRLLRWKVRPPEYYRELRLLRLWLPRGGDLRERKLPVSGAGADCVR
jgi:hypothetical protein